MEGHTACEEARNMKIAIMVRAFLQTPVPNDVAYSPATIAQSMAEGLKQAGHDVTFFGPDGSAINVPLESGGLRALATTQRELDKLVSSTDLFQNYRFSLYDERLAKQMLEQANRGDFDCVVFHHFESMLPLGSLYPKVPIVHVLHDYLDQQRCDVLEMHSSPNQYFISISNSQRSNAPDLHYVSTIYNGIDTEHFVPNGDAENYLMFSGRITSAKGVKEAVQVAMQAGRRLLIAGSLSKADYWYFDEHIKPYLNDKILYLGMLDKEQLVKYYQKAAAVLMPIQWQEPFGLSMAEANACGTPVIAFNRGSVPEVIVDGKNGFIVDNSAEMIMAIEKLNTLKRSDCRRHAVKYFSRQIMVKNYEKVLDQIIKTHESSPTNRRRRYTNTSKLVRQQIDRLRKSAISKTK